MARLSVTPGRVRPLELWAAARLREGGTAIYAWPELFLPPVPVLIKEPGAGLCVLDDLFRINAANRIDAGAFLRGDALVDLAAFGVDLIDQSWNIRATVADDRIAVETFAYCTAFTRGTSPQIRGIWLVKAPSAASATGRPT